MHASAPALVSVCIYAYVQSEYVTQYMCTIVGGCLHTSMNACVRALVCIPSFKCVDI